MSPAVASAALPTSRWCPTPEQLMILEEMYRGGIKTPTASQIHHITSYLSLYGRIEGKNVFYWFQNHKARDRQRLRRKLLLHQHTLHLHKQLMYHQRLYDHNQQSHLLHYLDSHLRQLNQGRVEDASTQLLNGTWKADLPEIGYNVVNLTNRFRDRDSTMKMAMVNRDATSPCRGETFKTLELFPIITTVSLKDQCTTSTQVPNPSLLLE
ncbi:hypothetical protein RJ639_036924 [Escallonia herrerae]|uniref:Homeobox domain-containing protein n=1 Tax=Escallonia herrerae TaxID=1293975 RepID=A0AA88WY65_9ASTE|nr:hypothetical protein RJ639_036924 [Escallonia herrerae]